MGIVAIILAMLFTLIGTGNAKATVTIVPPMPQHSPAEMQAEADLIEWDEFWSDSFHEHADEFAALFNSYTYKRTSNGRSMINGKFVAMPKGK